MELSALRRTAAEVLAAAVYETFPQVELLGGGDTYSGFYYDFFFPHLIHPELHLQIEERMRQVVREKREIENREMVAVSAREFLKSRGHKARAEMPEGTGLFSVMQMGSFIDLVSGDLLTNSSQAACFKLFPPILLEEKRMRILGSAYPSKEELNGFLKKRTGYASRRHEKIGAMKKFWLDVPEGKVWLSEGILALDKLTRKFKENLYEVSCPPGSEPEVLHKRLLSELGVDAVVEVLTCMGESSSVEDAGWLDSETSREVRITTSLKNMTSLLQSIGKTLTILGFNYCIRLAASGRKGGNDRSVEAALATLQWPVEASSKRGGAATRVDFLVEDALGRQWSAATVFARECLSCHVNIERNLALLLELCGVCKFFSENEI